MSDYTNSDHLAYSVQIDMFGIDADTMTDAGVPASELDPIESCSLTPGDPSPLGLTADGELAYPVHVKRTFIGLDRRDIAELAYLHAQAHCFTEEPSYPLSAGPERLFMSLLSEALPRALYPDNNHGEIARTQDVAQLIAGNLDVFAKRMKQ